MTNALASAAVVTIAVQAGGELHAWDVAARKEKVMSSNSHPDAIWSLSFSPDRAPLGVRQSGTRPSSSGTCRPGKN